MADASPQTTTTSTDLTKFSGAHVKLERDRPASISQVTHVNSYTPEAAKAAAIRAGATPPAPLTDMTVLLARLADGAAAAPDISGFVRNPKLVKEDIKAQQLDLGIFRDGLDEAGRIERAEDLRLAANALFAAGRWRVAQIGYLVALWLLRRGSAACPSVCCAAVAMGRTDGPQFDQGLAEVPAIIGVAEYAADEAAPSGGAAALCTSLHLNLAAAALKTSDWPIAKAACARVLAADEAHAKAAFRLAKAHEGEGDRQAALAALAPLLKRDPQHAEARRLREALRREAAEERGRFKGLFDEAKEAS